jgi:hypothetical protein
LKKNSNLPESPFFKAGKGPLIHRIPAKNLSSLGKREAGRDFGEGLFKALKCYIIFYSGFAGLGGKNEKMEVHDLRLSPRGRTSAGFLPGLRGPHVPVHPL